MTKIAVLRTLRCARRFITGCANIARLLQRRFHQEGQCEGSRRTFTAVMRHFLIWSAALWMPRAPAPLSGRVPARASAAALVTHTGCSHTRLPLHLRAVPGAVNLAVIAVTANAHRHPAAPAVVSPKRPLSHRNAILLQDWTMPCAACIKAPWSCFSHAPHRRPGVDRQIVPGPSPLRRPLARITKIGRTAGVGKPASIPRCVASRAILQRSITLRQRRGFKPSQCGGLFLASETGLILESASGLKPSTHNRTSV